MPSRIVVPVVLLLAVLATATNAGAVSAVPRRDSILTIAATPNPIITGDDVLIYGQLNLPDLGGKEVVLHRQLVPGGFFATEGSTTVATSGFYEFEDVVATTRSWYVTLSGAPGARSRTVHETVAAALTIAASATLSYTNRPLTFSGSIAPAGLHSGETVFLQEQTGLSGDSWTTVGHAVVDTSSSYEITRSFRLPGDHVMRTFFRGDEHNVTASSDLVTVVTQQAENPSFTIGTSAPTIATGSPVTVSGVLYEPGSTSVAVPATSVTLWGHTPGGRYTPIGTAATGPGGSYSFTEMPSRNEVYQVRTTQVPPPRRNSAQLFEGVGDVVTLAASAATSQVGGTVTFTGAVTPDNAGHVVYLERLGTDAHFHVVKIGAVMASSTYSFAWTFGAPGTKVFRALVLGGDTNLTDASPTVTVTVSLPAVQALPPAS